MGFKVIIEKSDDFDSLMASNEIIAPGPQQTVLVPSEDGATLLFPVTPAHLGEIPVTVTAVSPAISDAVTQRVLVKLIRLDGQQVTNYPENVFSPSLLIRTALHLACANGHGGVVTLLERGCQVNTQDRKKRTALIKVCSRQPCPRETSAFYSTEEEDAPSPDTEEGVTKAEIEKDEPGTEMDADDEGG
ncbi:hypothetical protein CB1_001259002 [Camelus ferus]|nr:hypothetical protein CB1_001259002 [Camelus ferus]